MSDPTPTMDRWTELERLAKAVGVVKQAYDMTERGSEAWAEASWELGQAREKLFAAANPSAILDLITSARSVGGDVVELREALERLASSEAFDIPQAIDGPLAEELRQRLDYARAALSRIEAGGGSLQPQEAASVPTEQADRAVVDSMVRRFLTWRLPETFNPDNGVSFKPPGDGPNHRAEWPSGTNLFDYTQAEAMVRHMLEGEG